jgi:uncharacterized protein
MDPKIKNVLGAVLVVGVLALSYAGVTYSKSMGPGAYREFSVSGDATVVSVPDIAQFSFSVITEGGTDLGALSKDNIDKTNKAIAFLKDKGIDAKDIKTQNYSVDPRYTYPSCGPSAPGYIQSCPPASITGYTITQSVMVKIRDFTKIGDAMSGVVSNGANNVSGLSFTIDDPDALQNQAREEAIGKAKDKAEAVAKAGGFHLGKLVAIEDGASYDPYYGYGMGGDGYATKEMSAVAPQANVAPSIEPGSQDVKMTVTLRYQIR